MDVKFAEVDDFNYSDYRESYLELEEFSDRFLESALKFSLFPKDYPWPIDPFHNWSRIWEYPFVWNQIKSIKGGGKSCLRIADLGSGLTFFPWFLASKGNNVYALDNNLSLVPSNRITEEMKRELDIKGDISYFLSDARRISLRDNSVDAATHISLLEHLGDYSLALQETKRVLVKNGVLVMTFDVSLDGLPFGDGVPLNLNQVNRVIKFLENGSGGGTQFNLIPERALRFSNHPRKWTSEQRLKFDSVGDIWKWQINNRYIRPFIKIVRSRILIRPYFLIPIRIIRLLIFPNRFDMWTVMGIAVRKNDS